MLGAAIYFYIMKAKSLSRTNPYLQRSVKTGQWIVTNVASSTAVETKKSVSVVRERAISLQSSRPAKLPKKRAS